MTLDAPAPSCNINIRANDSHVNSDANTFRVVVHAHDNERKFPLCNKVVAFNGRTWTSGDLTITRREGRTDVAPKEVVGVFVTLLKRVECGWIEHGRAAWHAGLGGNSERPLRLRGVKDDDRAICGKVDFTRST